MMCATGRGLAVVCDSGGRIRRLVVDELGLDGALAAGVRLGDLVEPEARHELDAILSAAQAGHPVFDREIRIAAGGVPRALRAAATRHELDILFAMAGQRVALVRLHERLLAEHGLPIDGPASATGRLSPDAVHDDDRTDTISRHVARMSDDPGALARRLDEARRALDGLTAQKDRWLAVAAGDLRDTIDTAQGQAAYLEADGGLSLDEHQWNFVSRVRESAERMNGMIDLLADDRVAPGTGTSGRRPTDLGALVARVVAFCRGYASHPDIRVTSEIAPTPRATVVPDAIERAITDLVTGAMARAPLGTTVRVCVDRASDEVLVTVTEAGPGLREEDVARLYRPMIAPPPERNDDPGAAGLQTARRIAAMHGGRIDVRSTLGRGTTYAFVLPIDERRVPE